MLIDPGYSLFIFYFSEVNCFWVTATLNCLHWEVTTLFISMIWLTSPAPIKNVSLTATVSY